MSLSNLAIFSKKKKHYFFSFLFLENDLLVTGSFGRNIKIYDLKEKKVFLSIKKAHLEGMIIFSVLKTGELISFGTDAEINIWKINQKEYTLLYNLKGHSEMIGQVLPITKNKIASFSLDGTIRIWDRKLNFICVTIYNIKEFTSNRTFITYIPNYKTLLFFCREQS